MRTYTGSLVYNMFRLRGFKKRSIEPGAVQQMRGTRTPPPIYSFIRGRRLDAVAAGTSLAYLQEQSYTNGPSGELSQLWLLLGPRCRRYAPPTNKPRPHVLHNPTPKPCFNCKTRHPKSIFRASLSGATTLPGGLTLRRIGVHTKAPLWSLTETKSWPNPDSNWRN